MRGLNLSFDAALLARVEDAGLNASAPPQQRWLDGWLVRFSPGKAKRARCVNAVAAGRASIDERLAACEAVFAAADLPMIFRMTPFSEPPDLDARLESLGWRRFDDTRVMVASLEPETQVARPLDSAIHIQPMSLEPFARREFRGSPLAQRQAHAERLLNAPVPFQAFEMMVDGEPAACGQFALERDVVGLYDVFTAPAHRGHGMAGRLCAHLMDEARRRGARHAYLQVEFDNAPARAVYRRLGFTDAYAYHYRTRDPSAA